MLVTYALDTTLLPETERFAAWHDLLANSGAPVAVRSPHSADFAASARMIDLGELRLGWFHYPSLDMARTARHVRQSDLEQYQLALPLNGRSAIGQARRGHHVKPNEWTFVDTSRPYEAVHRADPTDPDELPGPSSMNILVPHARLPLPPKKITDLLAARLPADEGMGALLAQYLRRIATHPEQFPTSVATQLGDTALDLAAATLATWASAEDQLPHRVRQTALVARIRAHVDRHLPEADLNPATIAAAHHISVRTLHRLFAAEDVGIGELIRQRRLDRIRRDLVNPLLLDRPVHVVAARWGLTDSRHFSRMFRAVYAVTPQEYRRQHLAPGGDLLAADGGQGRPRRPQTVRRR